MSVRSWFGWMLAWCALISCAGVAQAAERGKRLNVVFILADDLGWKDVGCTGSTFYETPHIDRLAREGMRFTQGYAACPVCSPTRASIMTGKYPARVKITDWIGGHKAGALLPAEYIEHLPLEEVTIAEAMKEGGYVTASIGKWHLGAKGFLPEDQGFDVSIAAANGAGHPPDYFYPWQLKNKSKPGILATGHPGEYLTDRLTDEAVHFIEENEDKPFFLYLPHYAVHIPLGAKQDLIEKYKRKLEAMPPRQGKEFGREGEHKDKLVQDNPTYAAMIESLDQGVGRVMDKLAELGLDQNTIVIFTSDNGGVSTAQGFPTSNAPLRGGKGWLYEGGIREPVIVRWPGVTKAGALCDRPIVSNDWYPTLLEAAGLPAKPKQHVDAVSFVPLLRGQADAPDRGPIFWHYPHYSDQGGTPGSAVRSGDWKLIHWYEDDKYELFDLRDDPSEQKDLAAKEPAKVEEFKKVLEDWLKSVDANMPRPNVKHEQHADTGTD